MTSYGSRDYWEDRYGKSPSNEPYEWYANFTELRPELLPILHQVSEDLALIKPLIVGCGNSFLSHDMVLDGIPHVVSMDYSETVIDNMKAIHRNIQGLTYDVMDVMDMTYEDNSFNFVLDKGTLDAILCGHNSLENSSKMLSQVYRVLEDRGIFVVITYGAPAARLPYLEKHNWTVSYHQMKNGKYIYKMIIESK